VASKPFTAATVWTAASANDLTAVINRAELAGGAYTERLDFAKEDEETIEMRFQHHRLPGVLVVRVQRHRVGKQDAKMRQQFRDWAVLPPEHRGVNPPRSTP
jgi:hypothetical protein